VRTSPGQTEFENEFTLIVPGWDGKLSILTLTPAATEQPLLPKIFTVYMPALREVVLLITGFCAEERNPLGPVHK
jgi:hypothetical protein